MSGGGGDAPPPALSGGEFLIRLLQNPPQQSRRQQPIPPSPSAAVGPTVPLLYQSNPPDHNNNSSSSSSRSNHSHHQHFAPHNFFLQNPNPNLSPPQNQQQQQQQQQSHHFYNHNIINGRNPNFNLPRHHPHPQQQQQQEVQTKTNNNSLMFGSFSSSSNGGVSSSSSNSSSQLLGRDYYDRGGDGLGIRVVPNALDVEFQKSLKLNRDHEFNKPGEMPVRRTPPTPGFSGNGGRGAGSRNWSGGFERHSRVKGKGKYGDVGLGRGNEKGKEVGSGGGVSVERRVIGQFDRPGVPAGSNVHSVRASDFEESMLKLREDGGGDQMGKESDVVSTEVDDLDEHDTGMSVPEDESTEKSGKKKQRNKDYRSDKRGKWILNQRMRSFRRQIECRGDINLLNTPFLEIYESLIPSEEEKAKQKQLLALLEKHVTKEWPEARLFLYGSCANSFGFRKSDIDVCLEIEDADVNKSEVLLKLAEILKSDNLQNVQALTHARVPIVKLMDPATGISCDICVNNLLAVINTKLLRDYALIDTRLRQLAFIVKHWAKLRGVNETYQGTLSSYAYVLMCIHFLQQRTPPILPCLQGMDKTYAVNVDNTECAFFDQVEKLRGFGTRNTESIAQLVWAFFSYWAYCHDYTNEVICVRMGSTLRKHDKDWTRRIGNDRHLICIEDPFEISHDLGRVVDKFSIRVLREEFERAAEIMQYDADPCVTLFTPYVPS